MTRLEALKKLKEGFQITHIYFTSTEYLYNDEQGRIMTEDGYEFRNRFFSDPMFESGWRIFEEPKPIST